MRAPAVVVAVTALALAGCGGASEADPDTLTAAEWRRAANAVCRDIGPRVRAIAVPEAEGSILPFTSEVIPLWKDEEDRIRGLARPPELEARAEELADALSELNVALLEIHVATQRRDGGRRLDGIRRGEAAASVLKRAARELRLPACAAQRIP